MEEYTGYVEDAKWVSRDKNIFPRWNTFRAFDVHFPHFHLTKADCRLPSPVLQLQLAMGLAVGVDQVLCEDLWNEALKNHEQANDIVFLTTRGDDVHFGNGKMLKDGKVTIKYRDKPRDVACKQDAKRLLEQRKPVIEHIKRLKQELYECEGDLCRLSTIFTNKHGGGPGTPQKE